MRNTIIAAASGALLTYLLGAFAAASFDISVWPGKGRVICAMLMFGMAGLGAVAHPFFFHKKG